MKTRLLKKLRKKAKKEWILKSKYPGIWLCYLKKHPDYYRQYMYCGTNLESAKIELQSARRGEILNLVSKLRDEQINKEFKKI